MTDTIQATVNGTRKRKTNAEVRTREYLTEEEIEGLVLQAKEGKNPERDALMIGMAFNHALRAAELVNLEWSQIDFTTGKIHIKRVKNSEDGVHFLRADELRALRRLRAANKDGRWVFMSRLNGPMTERAFHKMIAELAVDGGFIFPVHPHMLRHSKGYQLVNRGTDLRSIQTFMGHKNIQHTVRYTALAADRVKGLEQ